MKRVTVLPLLLFCAGLAQALVPVERAPPVKPKAELRGTQLQWKNLETIAGELVAATATELSWKSPLFEEPLRLRWDAIRRIQDAAPAAAGTEPFSVGLRDGSQLLGNLTVLDAERVVLKNARHGDLVLKRSEVLRISRLSGGKIIAAGPTGVAGWQMEEINPGEAAEGVAQMFAGPSGELVLPYWNTKVKLPVKIPERAMFEVELRFADQPRFSLRFDGEATKSLRLETWDDELVVTLGDEFQSVRRLGSGERELSVRLCWDRVRKSGALYSASGEMLAEWNFHDECPAGKSWGVHNKGCETKVTRFCVREWDGQPPRKAALAVARVELTDGRVLDSGSPGVAADTLKINETAVPLADIAEIDFSPDAPVVKGDAPTFTFADGSFCRGQILEVAEGRAKLETSSGFGPLSFSALHLRQVRPAKMEAGAVKADLDELEIDSTRLHGTLATGGDGRLRWMPVGGLEGAVPISTAKLKITRALLPGTEYPPAPALFYTSQSEIIPGVFRGVNGEEVEIESEVIEAKTLAAGSLDAVQFGAVTQMGVAGFDGPGWRIVKGDEKTVRAAKDRLEMEPGSAYAHALVLQSTEFRFSFDPGDTGTFRLRLFSDGGDLKQSTNFVVAPVSGNVYVSLEDPDGQFSGFTNTPGPPGKPMVVRVEIKDTVISFYIGERVMQRAVFDPKKRKGSGLVIEPSTSFINENTSTVKLTDFSSPMVPGRTWLPDINPEMKTQALTVPRFRKERPPKHALIATNGDVLRGEIEAATATHFGFAAGLEKLRIPRERVNAAIWLKPAHAEGKTEPEPELVDVLSQPLKRTARFGGVQLGTLLAMLTRDVPALKFNNRVPSGSALRGANFAITEKQTLREALDQMCVAFPIHYIVEADGSVTLQAGPAADQKFVERTYWLKSGTFSTDRPAQAHLVQKGFAFPEGASARWNPAARQLVVRHDAGVQMKIEELLKAEFGINSAPATHWFVLTNGARLGFSVDHFERDSIVGRHPEYGQCRVPLALVFSIQTTRPEATAAMRALSDWRVMPAREPVIAEEGGESSALLGKEAAAFKLPLLSGGTFELASERGKIVVLDFWATWCAPCIKAIPELIASVAAFPTDRVKLIGVNQGESMDAVKRFIETRNWQLAAAMDVDQKVAQKFGVTGIPHTVVVGPDGKVAWEKTGFSPDGAAEAARVIKSLLDVGGPGAK